jgi:hypothetical protein
MMGDLCPKSSAKAKKASSRQRGRLETAEAWMRKAVERLEKESG